jgi:hypothetical protein
MSNLLHVDEVLFSGLDVEPVMEIKIDDAPSKSGKRNGRKRVSKSFWIFYWCLYISKYSLNAISTTYG